MAYLPTRVQLSHALYNVSLNIYIYIFIFFFKVNAEFVKGFWLTTNLANPQKMLLFNKIKERTTFYTSYSNVSVHIPLFFSPCQIQLVLP